jgi:transposase
MNYNTTYVGMDVHKKSISVRVLYPGDDVDILEFDNTVKSTQKFLKRLKKKAPGEILCCYEAGPCGYYLQRAFTKANVPCIVVAPSLIPVKPGERIKTDRRDAKKLAELLKAGLLTEVHPPTEDEEAVRDLCRLRTRVVEDIMRCRHRISKLLLKQGVKYTEGKKHWTIKHQKWLNKLKFDNATVQYIFESHLLALEQNLERRQLLDDKITEISQSESYRERVGWLRCLRGIETTSAMIILSELHDFRRFTSPRALMSYLGMTPSEYSSSDKQSRGGITKAGNKHVRRILTEAAWTYRNRPSVGAKLRNRRSGQPGPIIAIADKAQQRLHSKYMKMMFRKKQHNKVITAVGRELVGFIWAILSMEMRTGVVN